MRWLWRHLSRAVAGLAAAAVLAAAAQATDQLEVAPTAVIPPGQEALLLAMLGRGVALPESCALSDGRILRSVVKATYSCPLGAVVVELAHPDDAGDAAATTQQFALRVESGSPPESLLDALTASVRAQEDQFQWVRPAEVDAAPLDPGIGEQLGPDEPRW